MSIEDTVKKRIEQLVSQAMSLSVGNKIGQVLTKEQMQQCSGWMGAALNVIQLVVSNPDNGYRKKAEEIASRNVGAMIASHVAEFRHLLENLLQDIELGLLTDIADHARAETFDNFLDHSKSYIRDNRKSEAGVIAGVVFEDSLRSICRKHNITEKDVKLDNLINELVKKDILSQTKAKRARAAAHVRTKATHAQWDEFDVDDVKGAIQFTEELVLSELE